MIHRKFLILIFFLLQSQGIAQPLITDSWYYIEVDDQKSKWGDYDDPDWLRYFGLDMADVNGDHYLDILSGRTVYINPGGDMTGTWQKTDVGKNIDGILFTDVDGDDFADFIAQALPDVFWAEATDKQGTSWFFRKIGEVPPTSHVNSQGFEKAQLIAGGKEEFLIAGAGNIYGFSIPADPETMTWKRLLLAENTSDEGIGIGDIDGDGDLDFAAGRRPENGEEPLILVWFENPGIFTANWKGMEIGNSNHPIDRIETGDLNGDKRTDIVITEERWPGLEPDGNLFWFEHPANDQPEQWPRHRIVTQYSMNNLDIADMDQDGDQDIITSEHKGPDLETQCWVNDGHGNFEKTLIDKAKESHLGTQLADLDQDGDLDIVSDAWDHYRMMHVWRNDAIPTDPVKWKHYSTVSGDLPVPNNGTQQTASLVLDIDKDGVNEFVITERTEAPAVVWYKFNNYKWDRYILEAGPLRIEAGSAHYDIDGDGDEDIVFGGESRSNEVWWWENPYPRYNREKSWKRHTIKSSGATKHHDQMFGDFDGDGQSELVFWNQGAGKLFLAEIPADPRNADSWPMKVIFSYNTDSQMEQRGQEGYPAWKMINEHEGLAPSDIDGDGITDIVGGGRWFKYDGHGGFLENIIDAGYGFTRAAAAQFIEGGRPEVILVVGDGQAPLVMYECREGTWVATTILNTVDNGHTLQALDFNQDGHMDLFSAEMRFGEDNPDSKAQILLGDGRGNFRRMILVEGFGLHESRLTDLDGDGDFDLLGKPYSWKTPRLDIWINK